MKKLIAIGALMIVVAWFVEPSRIVISGDDAVPILPPAHRETSSASNWSVGTPLTFATTAGTAGSYTCGTTTTVGSTSNVIVSSASSL